MRRHDPYSQIDPASLIARDWLALSRTRLANERTLLAYLRTSVSLIGLGLITAQWFDHRIAVITGVTLVVLGVILLAVGGLRFVQEHRRCHLPIPPDSDVDVDTR